MQSLTFTSKARNLLMLQERLQSAKVLPLRITTKKQVLEDINNVLLCTQGFCMEHGIEAIIVRSSSLSEDSMQSSNAGAFLSIANIDVRPLCQLDSQSLCDISTLCNAETFSCKAESFAHDSKSLACDSESSLCHSESSSCHSESSLCHSKSSSCHSEPHRCHSEPHRCHSEFSLCHSESSSCHSESSLCHSERSEESTKDIHSQIIEKIAYIKNAFLQVAHSMPNENDEILIQPHLESITLCGVAFSVDKDNFSPYYCIECDSSGSNSSITDGSSKEKISYFRYRGAIPSQERACPTNRNSYKNIETKLEQVICLIQELETLFHHEFIDVEFAFAHTNNHTTESLYLLQVRPLVQSRTNLFNALPQDALNRLSKRLISFFKKTPNVLGDRAIFGVMPDWNPAEIIGLRPKRLALSLYKEIVTDTIWAYQRDNYGYKALHAHPLMHSFLGIPYIDVRASFNSFIPKDLDSKIAEKLVNYYLDKLAINPHFHDKVEFEIVFSCYDFDTPNALQTLLHSGFNSNEIKRIEFALLELTNSIIDPKNGYYAKDLEKVSKIQDSYHCILHSNYSLIDKIYWSLQECKRLGTLPFAGIARAGFVAVLMLNSLVKIGFLSQKERQSFLNTLNTISKQLAYSSANLNESNMAEFLAQFGHLRAGSYDILSPRYDEDFSHYFSLSAAHTPLCHEPFSLSDARYAQLDRILKEHGLKIDSQEFFHFLKVAIEGREYAKFEFSKLLSYTLVLVGELGKHYDIEKADMAHLDIHDILRLYSSLYSKSPKQKLLDSIAKHKQEYDLTLAIKLPPLITNQSQIFHFQTDQVMPNFITHKQITAQTALHTDSNLEGKIVLIYAADPGYDYLFTKNIAGFITCYGGANSHMAIRASEQGMPAVIGVGEEAFAKYGKAERLLIECDNERIVIV